MALPELDGTLANCRWEYIQRRLKKHQLDSEPGTRNGSLLGNDCSGFIKFRGSIGHLARFVVYSSVSGRFTLDSNPYESGLEPWNLGLT